MARYGYARSPTVRGNMELDRAKTILRKTGRVVFNAEIVDGRKARGWIKVDGRTYTAQQVIDMAMEKAPRTTIRHLASTGEKT